MNLLEVTGLKKVYTQRLGAKPNVALRNVSFSAAKGEYIAIMGESGSGKTTLLNILATLDKATAGVVMLSGVDITKIKDSDSALFRREHLGFVFQDFNLLDTFSVRDNIFLPLVLMGKSYDEMNSRLLPLAAKLGISDLLDRYPYEISGGQKQRTAVARALITNPDILLADEPTGALDSKASEELLNLFGEINRDGQTILMVTHSVKAASSASRVLFIKDGEVYHQIYKGISGAEEFYAKINDTLTVTLGFKTIILIGQDLAFTGGRGHTKDAYDDEKKNIMDAQEEMNCEVESIDGGMVKTEVRMRAYLKWFESNIISHPDVKVIDATEGGALIHGSIVMTLDEAINRECINQLDLKSVITGIEPQFSLVEQEEIYTYLEGIEGELDRIKGLLGDGIKAYNRLRDALKSGNNELARAELEKVGITNSLDKREPLFSLIRKYAVEERYRVNDELSRSESDDSMAAVNSGIELLESYIKGIDKMREDIHLLN